MSNDRGKPMIDRLLVPVPAIEGRRVRLQWHLSDEDFDRYLAAFRAEPEQGGIEVKHLATECDPFRTFRVKFSGFELFVYGSARSGATAVVETDA
jgi:hypothetical protein